MSNESIERYAQDAREALHKFCNAAQLLKEERENARDERDELRDRLDAALEGEAEAWGWCDKLEAERDELKAELEQARMERAAAEHLSYFGPASILPRIITADELKVGQCVAAQFQSDDWATGVTTRNSSDELILAYSVPGSSFRPLVKNFKAFVLLADAPPQEPEPEKPGYQKFYDSIGAKDLLFRDSAMRKIGEGDYRVRAAKPEPARPGRVVKPEELREGDVFDAHHVSGICESYLNQEVTRTETNDGKPAVGNHGALWTGHMLDPSRWEFRLISRKPPTVADSPITVHALHGEPIDTRNAAVVYKSGTQTEVSIAYQSWAVEDTIEGDDAVTDWTPLVPVGQEG